MEPGKARGPYAKTKARRDAIVQAARDGFAERGYAAASLRDIAERAGITHTGLLHHFRTKEELLIEVLAQRDATEWERGLAGVPDADALAPYFGDLLLRHQETPELMRLWLELSAAASRPEHPAHAFFADRLKQARARAARGIRALAAEGRLRGTVDADTATTLFFAVLDGLQLQWLLDPGIDIVEPLNRFLDMILAPDAQGR
jgi:AcrR family transcriptional regulator